MEGVVHVPRFVVDLDDPPDERWKEVASTFAPHMKAFERHLDRIVTQFYGSSGSALESLISSLLAHCANVGVVYYANELKAISEVTGLPLGKLVMMQLVYEAAASCTSIITDFTDAESDCPFHIRTMDWEMEYLKPLTLEVEFKRGGVTECLASTWAGYVGVLTGIRPGVCSVAVNFRVTDEGTLWQNLKEAMKRSWPVGFLVREVMTDATEPCTTAAQVWQLIALSQGVATITSVGMTTTSSHRLSNTTPPNWEGWLLTRDRDADTHPWTLHEHGVIVQPNMDHWSTDERDSIMYSLERRHLARTCLASLDDTGQVEDGHVSPDALWQLLSHYPITNDITLYGTLMCPGRCVVGGLGVINARCYETRIPVPLSSARKAHRVAGLKMPIALDADDSHTFMPLPLLQATADSAALTMLSHDLALIARELRVCQRCGREYCPKLCAGVTGGCVHTGEYHTAFSDCRVRCAAKLLKHGDVGKCHWSCCAQTIQDARGTCSVSEAHEPAAIGF